MLAKETNFANVRLQINRGTPSIQFWSNVYAFSNGGETVVIVLTINPRVESFSLENQGEEILLYLENRYKSDEGLLSSQKLKNLVTTTSTRFGDASLSIQMAVVEGGMIHLCTERGGEVVLERAQNTYKLISNNSSGKFLSGPVKEGDLFTLTSGDEDYSSGVELIPILSKLGVEIVPAKTEEALASQTGFLPPRRTFNFLSIKEGGLLNLVIGKLKGATGEEIRSKKTVVSVGVILLVLFGVSIAFGLFQKVRKERVAKYESRFIEAQQNYQSSLVQYELNSQIAKELFLKSQGTVEALKNEGVKDERLIELDTKLKTDASRLLGIVEVKPELFLDLANLRSGIEPAEFVLHQEKLVVLDKAGNRFVSVLTDATGTIVLGGTDKLGSITSVATYAGRIFTINDKGVLEITSKSTATAVESDGDWGNPVKVRAFGGNLYVSTQEGEIWRFVAINKGFSEKQRWLGQGVILLGEHKDLALDGSVWVLYKNSKIEKYTRGAQNSFSVKDVSFSEATALYTDEDTMSLFVLDANNARIVQLTKTGELEKEYKSEEFKDGRDVVVSTKAGKIFVLTSAKILELSLAK